MFVDQLLEYISEHKRNVMVFASLIITIALLITLFISITRAGKVAVDVRIVPNDAMLIMKDVSSAEKRIQTGTEYIAPGDYTVVAKKDGWETYTGQLSVRNDRTNRLAIGLTPVSDEAWSWASSERGQAAFKTLEVATANGSEERGERLTAKYPILDNLPVMDPYYTIDYMVTDQANETIELRIATESPYYRREALKKLRDLGYVIGDYKIRFDDYDSPLGVAQ